MDILHKNKVNQISNGVKILIVYATAGAGHRRAAEAIYNQAKKKNLDATIVDILDYANPLFRCFYSRGYILLIKYFPFVWKIIFYISNNPKDNLLKRIADFCNRVNVFRYFSFLKKEKFDVVISTHFMSTEVTSRLKEKLNLKLISVVTDFYPHGLWYHKLTDKYTVASDKTKSVLVSYGVSSDDIEVTGIPTDAKFSISLDKGKVAKKLSITPGRFSILIMTGAIGMGPIERIVNLLHDDVCIIVVCGSNKKLFSHLLKMASGNLKVLGLVKNVDELMSASDLIITKPGGMTISESLVKNLPMVFFSIIPGQEADNAEFIVKHGAGIILEDVNRIGDIVSELKDSREKLEKYKQNVAALLCPDSAAKILDVALKT
ncbi:MAG TPA: hypothetical protein ENH41_05075 [Candidatus Omnitrophica bacterium]|nr:hypothetical protein [Candidatus Omnitrophota bacterium]